MRILLVGTGPPATGGIATYLQWLLASDVARQHDIDLLNVTVAGSREGGRFSAANVWRTAADSWRLWRAAADADVVHIHSAVAPAVTLLRLGLLATTARARGSRVLIHAHGGLLPLWLRGRFRRSLARVAFASAAHIVCVSEKGRAALIGVVPDSRTSVVVNGVDAESFRFHAGRPKGHRILYVGVLTERKGVLDLLAASERLAARGIEHEVVLVGGVPDDGAAAHAGVLRAATRATVLGTVPASEMAAVYYGADIFCLPSWWEALPFALLEAMSTGLAVVATSVGDIPRVVEDGVSGVLVPPKDVGALASSLERLLGDSALREHLGVAGARRVASEYSASRTASELLSLYDRIGHRT